MSPVASRAYRVERLGLTLWRRRRPPGVVGGAGAAVEGAAAPEVVRPGGVVEQLAVVEAEVAACSLCSLHRHRTRTVFGVGSTAPGWLLIGEAPGAEEDRRGEPFVGRAGKLLDNMLAAAGLGRSQVYITNILKCRPPENRDPRPEEAAACAPYLRRQVELLRPRLILALGRVAAANLLGVQGPLGRLRGRVHEHPELGVPVVVTYHPAYLLRSPSAKRQAWEDLQLALGVAA